MTENPNNPVQYPVDMPEGFNLNLPPVEVLKPTELNLDPVAELSREYRIDVSIWRMRQYTAWTEAAQKNDSRTANALMCEVVKVWPFASDPGNADSYQDLSLLEYAKTLREVAKAVAAVFQSVN
jgi:hypothetical protein